jgi:hypothetical protein
MASGATLGATPPRPSSEQPSSHRLGGGPLVPLDQVPVHVLGDRDAGMAEDLGDDMQRRALGKHQRGAGSGAPRAGLCVGTPARAVPAIAVPAI